MCEQLVYQGDELVVQDHERRLPAPSLSQIPHEGLVGLVLPALSSTSRIVSSRCGEQMMAS
jgi:hypothetical protein